MRKSRSTLPRGVVDMNVKGRWVGVALASSLALAGVVVSGTGTFASAATKPKLKIAYMEYVANTYDAPMLAAAKAYAAKVHATVTVYNAEASPTTQVTQLQDVVASHKFTGVLFQPIYGPAETSAVSAALKAKLKVVNIDQILGTKYTDTGIQVKGLDGNVVFSPSTIGTQLGAYTNAACAGKNPCDIALVHNYIGDEPDSQITTSFNAEIAKYPHDSIVSTSGDGQYTIATAETVVENILTSFPKLNVIASSDQDCEGAQLAFKADNVKTVKLTCYGGSKAAVAGVKSKLWTADIAQLPATEGRLGMELLVRAIETGKPQGSKNPVAALPNKGVIVLSNVAKFKAEWAG
jgi:ribose transport system substrate-binding protein